MQKVEPEGELEQFGRHEGGVAGAGVEQDLRAELLDHLDDETFTRLTRRALGHYGDLSKLVASPLTQLPVIDERLAARGAPDQPLERAVELKALLADRIAHQLEVHGLPPDVLTIEVTESSVMQALERRLGGHPQEVAKSMKRVSAQDKVEREMLKLLVRDVETYHAFVGTLQPEHAVDAQIGGAIYLFGGCVTMLLSALLAFALSTGRHVWVKEWGVFVVACLVATPSFFWALPAIGAQPIAPQFVQEGHVFRMASYGEWMLLMGAFVYALFSEATHSKLAR